MGVNACILALIAICIAAALLTLWAEDRGHPPKVVAFGAFVALGALFGAAGLAFIDGTAQ
jgi:hypothetical protein